ncbi:MAG: DUF6883 domain-containing protein [Pseudomonadota bacterium]
MFLPKLMHIRIDKEKLSGYVLNLNHPEGRHKARVFMSALGLTSSDASWLAQEIERALLSARFEMQYETEWGVIYRAQLQIQRGDRCAKVRTVWLCTDQETRLVTCFVDGECDESA